MDDYAACALGTATEPTCVSNGNKGPGTRNNTLLIDPRLVPFLTNVKVDSEKAISVHRPVQAFFQLPREQIKALRWRLPKDFAGLGISAAYLEDGPEPSQPDNSVERTPDGLVDWTRKLETVIDRKMQKLHIQDPVLFPYPGLPKASKGRCVERRAVLKPIEAPCRQARHNDYQPPGEAVTIRSKQRSGKHADCAVCFTSSPNTHTTRPTILLNKCKMSGTPP